MIVVTFVGMWLSSSWYDGWLCHLSTMIWFLSSYCDVYLCLGDSNGSKIYTIIDKKSNQWSLVSYIIEVKYILVIIVISNV